MSVGNLDSKPLPASVQVLLPNHLGHAFDYACSTPLAPGDYVQVPFGSREMPGVVWGEGDPARAGRLKAVAALHSHLPPMQQPMRDFLAWAAWYTASPLGAVLKMALPVAEALKEPNKRERNSLVPHIGHGEPVALAEEQKAAAEALAEKLGQGFSVTLLDGVTGSGKTEVYFDTIARALAEPGTQVLVLLPEISLSVQWLERFQKRFGFTPLVWHSGIPPGARKHGWRAVANGEARLVVGARSALFLPYKNLKLIVADEEHESSYKQEEGVIYHARDMAVARARFEKIPAVLVSATPALETWRNVAEGKYKAIHLKARHAGAAMPEVALIDMKSAPLERGNFISQPLRNALVEALRCGHQSILFLNRRGYAPLLLCRACGHRFQCPQCTSWLVLHKGRPRLQCHHCGYSIPQPKDCPSCKAEDTLFACGPGVERVAEEVAEFLPKARLAVLASDMGESYGDVQELIHRMEGGGIDILVGTQMIAKGHHFKNLALVGVVDADLGLAGGDLRAAERTWQLLHQVSGRAGREEVAGRVLVQSFQPLHPVMQAWRRTTARPSCAWSWRSGSGPRCRPSIALPRSSWKGRRRRAVGAMARDLARKAPKAEGVQLLGPAPAPLYLLRGKYRQRLLLRAGKNINVQSYLAAWLGQEAGPRSLRVKIDVDPYSFL